MYKIAIAGNPNSGKTCVFNNLTGGVQHVGNYPGVTVEFAEGITRFEGNKLKVIDLPGTYSLTAYSQEEVVARDYIIEESPDAIINVIDSGNLERNLYLTVQLLELKVPVVIALNMVDVAEKRGHKINPDVLRQLLGVKVIETVASRNTGTLELKRACLETIENNIVPKPLAYSHELSEILFEMEKSIDGTGIFPEKFPKRWLALKLLEEDQEVIDKFSSPEGARVLKTLDRCRKLLMNHSGEDTVTAVVEARYGIANGLVRKAVTMTAVSKRMLTEKIDTVLCNRILGPVILLAVVYSLFTSVFKIADELSWIPLLNGQWISPIGLFEMFFEFLGNSADSHIHNEMLRSLVKDGIIGGVGGVMGFVPLIFFMFLFISILEDTGYIARIAFILDRVLRAFGLQGKSILSLIVSGGLGGGGCAVPGVMATRTLREEKDRIVTILVTPMMNCGAKMPVYAMLIAAFFTRSRGPMMFLLWFLSWFFALCSAFVLRKFVVRGEQTPFVMELPVYHLPTLRGMFIHTWHRTWMYIKKAGTVILGINIIFWLTMYFPRQDTKQYDNERLRAKNGFTANLRSSGIDGITLSNDGTLAASSLERLKAEGKDNIIKNYNSYMEKLKEAVKKQNASQLSYSIAGRVGRSLEGVTRYAGFDWKINIALIGGFAAKELVLGTMGTVYSMGDVDPEQPDALSARLARSEEWNPLKAFVLMIFVMVYAPCLPTVAAIKKETGSWFWPVFAVIYSTVFGLVIALIAFQVGKLLLL